MTKDQRLTTWVLVSAALMVVGVFTTLYDRQHVQHVIDQTGIFGQALVNVGWGLNLALLASASMAVAGIVWAIRGHS